MNKIQIIGTAVLAGTIAFGCSRREAAPEAADKAVDAKAADTKAVEVNGRVLTLAALEADVAKLIAAQGDRIPSNQLEYARQMFKNQLAQNFVVENVLSDAAKAAGFSVSDEDRKAREEEFLKSVANQPGGPKNLEEFCERFPLGKERAMAEFENGILIDKLLKAQTADSTTDYEAEARKYIDGIVSNNAIAAESDATALTKIKALQAKLADPAVTNVPALFAELAKTESACSSGSRGGDLDPFTHGQMVPEFDKAAFELPVGKVSEPVKTQFGYHLILVTKKFPAVEAKDDQPAEPEKVQCSHILIKTETPRDVPSQDEVVERLKKRDERVKMNDFIKATVKKAKISTSEEFKNLVPQEEEN